MTEGAEIFVIWGLFPLDHVNEDCLVTDMPEPIRAGGK